MAIADCGARRRVDGGRVGLRSACDVDDCVLVDDLLLAPRSVLHRGGGYAVGVSERAFGMLVDLGDSVDGEDVALRPGLTETVPEVFAGVGEAGLVEREAVVKSRVQGAITTQGESVPELGQADENERE